MRRLRTTLVILGACAPAAVAQQARQPPMPMLLGTPAAPPKLEPPPKLDTPAKPPAKAAALTLIGAAPSADSVVQGAPAVVELTFNLPVEVGECRIQVRGSKNHRFDSGAVRQVADDQHMAIEVKRLLPGRYTVAWRASGHDGQRQHGKFVFFVSS